MIYKGYQINPPFIYENSKEVFIKTWRQDRDEETCKRIVDNEIAAAKAFAPLPNKQLALCQLGDECELENGSQAMADFSDRVNDYFHNQQNSDL